MILLQPKVSRTLQADSKSNVQENPTVVWRKIKNSVFPFLTQRFTATKIVLLKCWIGSRTVKQASTRQKMLRHKQTHIRKFVLWKKWHKKFAEEVKKYKTVGTMDCLCGKKIKLDHYLRQYTKFNSRWT